jgi:iron complex transport system substrate-binding protein
VKKHLSITLASVAAAAALALSACGGTTSGGSDSTASPSKAALGSASTEKLPAAKDALKLKGHVAAQDLEDMQPVVKDAQPSLPATVTDATGRQITVKNLDRMLALDLYGTLTDTVIGLGLQDKLVGRSNSDTQASLKDLPTVTENGHDLNVEAVLNLKPTVVLTNNTIGSKDKYDQLAKAGVTVVTFDETPSLDKIDDSIDAVGQAVGMQDAADTLAQETDKRLDQAKATVKELAAKTPTKPRGAVLYMRGTAGVFFILGKDYGAGDLLSNLGLEDVAAENNITQLKPANPESLVKLNPDVILAMSKGLESTGGMDGLLKRPGVAATKAGANKRVITAADGQLLSYGPRTPDNLVSPAKGRPRRRAFPLPPRTRRTGTATTAGSSSATAATAAHVRGSPA